MDHQYRENGARNIDSNYNQMRAYVECSLNYTLSTIPSNNRRSFGDSGKVLTVSVLEFYSLFHIFSIKTNYRLD